MSDQLPVADVPGGRPGHGRVVVRRSTAGGPDPAIDPERRSAPSAVGSR